MGKPDQPRNPDNGRWRKRGVTFTVAATIGLGMAYFGTTGGASTAARPASSSSVKAKDRSFTKVVARLEKQGRTVRRLDEAFDQDCARQSYGQVQDYLRANPCEGLGRALFEITESGVTVVVAVSVVDMPDEPTPGSCTGSSTPTAPATSQSSAIRAESRGPASSTRPDATRRRS
ncbi:hypothetical protein [Pseudonocardia oroxyli]|uniref:Uncharacterized protein n=1 Tax=Pseudonocardia oroxyli TaxID=366584 RepID=A0A1G7ZSB5_PSEOR|nr:hypothetical protein [Pseudonocardia oroxyli]SDH11568.1 hypothetical protein SAMN05216377_11926 [Pseudonocardia oroxyli]